MTIRPMKGKERQEETEKKKLDSAARRARWIKLRENGVSVIEISRQLSWLRVQQQFAFFPLGLSAA